MSIEFKPTWLYVKAHRITGLKYFGKTIRNPHEYDGSGVYWKAHLKKNGKFVDTVWAHLYTDPVLLKEEAEFFSKIYEVKTSSEWANLIEENGSTGGKLYDQTTKEHRRFMSERTTGKKMPETHGKNVSISKTGVKRPEIVGKQVSQRLKNVPKSEIHKTRISKSLTDVSKSESHKINLSEAIKNLTKIECPYCGKMANPGNAKRWHFNECRNK